MERTTPVHQAVLANVVEYVEHDTALVRRGLLHRASLAWEVITSGLTELWAHKMRSMLTLTLLMLGVFALVVMGSMAEKINLLIDGGTRYYSDKVIIADGSTAAGGFSSTPISVGRVSEIEDVPGVDRGRALDRLAPEGHKPCIE